MSRRCYPIRAARVAAILALFSWPPTAGAQQAPVPFIYPDAAVEADSLGTRTAGEAVLATRQTVADGAICTTIDFEGVGDLSPIPVFDGISSPGWLAIIDADAGGSGNTAFEPSPETVAFWLGGASGSRDVEFDEPVSSVGFFYTSFVTVRLEAFDETGALVDSAAGGPNFNQGPGGDPNGFFNAWDPLEVSSDANDIVRVRVSGNVNQTAIDDLEVCRNLRIARIEVTQAIQEIQEIEDLEADLAADREPPVPLIENKPAVLRVYLEELQTAVRVEVAVEIAGVLNQSRSLRVQPGCDPDQQRRGDNGCQSIDFYFVPPGGDWTADVRLLSDSGTEVGRHELPLHSRDADRMILRSVSVCDARNPATGAWRCGRGARVGGLVDFLSRTAPTDQVDVDATDNYVFNDIAGYDADGNGSVQGPEVSRWFRDTVAEVGDYYGLWDWLLRTLGQERYYYGMIRNAVPGGTGGIADGIGSRGAMSRESTVRLGVEVNFETLAHEVGHMLGRRHTNTDVPRAAGGSPPGCYNLARDGGTDWPFADNTLQSANGPEVGFDVAARNPVLPEENFDWMGYCVPRWISPFTYRELMPPLGAERSASLTAPKLGSQTAPVQVAEGDFWTVSGSIEGGSALLDPIFELEIVGPTEPGTGDHRVELRDEAGDVLALRRFTPRVAVTETTEEDFGGAPAFFELLPALAGAAEIAVVGPAGADLAAVALAGEEPSVTFLAPAPGDLLSGLAELSWQISDPDSTRHWSALDYSTDGGETWDRLGILDGETSLVLDTALIAGSDQPLLRVTVSDGVNSGTAFADGFVVERKAPTVEILGPADGEVFRRGDLVWLRANAHDPDDGYLDGAAVEWFSSLDGALGTGRSAPTGTLSEGLHTLSVEAVDSDGNRATDSVNVRVAGEPPQLDLTVTALDRLPTTCVRVEIDARSLSTVVGLSTVEYSLDGGMSWIPVPLGDLPFGFTVPGSGFFHLVARTFDEAGQVDVRDQRFFIDSPCQTQNLPPVADAGPDRVVSCVDLAGTPVTLDGSGSFDPEGADLAYRWTGLFPEGGGEVSGVSPTVTLPLGSSMVTLVVNDGVLDSPLDSAEITVALAVTGLLPPLADLVPSGEEAPDPPRPFRLGRTLPLRLRLACGGERVGGDDVAAPRIVGLVRDGVELDLGALDLDAGRANDDGLELRPSDGLWVFNLSTAELEPGRYVVRIELPDDRLVDGAFELR